MKKFMLVLAVAAFAVACNNDSEKTETTTDSVSNVIDSTADAAKDSINTIVDSTKEKIDSVAGH